MERKFDGNKEYKLGTQKNPATVTVQTEKKQKEVAAQFEKNDWKYTIEVAPDKEEDLSDLEILLNRPKPVDIGTTVGRNDPCSCGSGKKYKKCCGK